MGREGNHARQLFGNWRETVAPIFDVRPLAASWDSGFHAEIERHHLSTALVGQVATSAQHYERSESLIGAVGVDHLLIQLYEAGHTTLDLDGEETHARAGDILVFDLSRPARSRASDMRAISLVLPRSLLALDAGSLDRAHGAVLSSASPLGSLAGDHLRSLLKAAPTLEPAAAPDIARASAQLLSACLSPTLMRDRDAPATLTTTVAMICRFIDRHIGDPGLDARVLCSAFGLSRSALYRLFAPIGGVSDYIRQRRLARARLALNASARERGGIGKIARQFGFSSDDAFSRAFKAQFGIAPRDAAHLRLSPSVEPDDGSLANWLRKLA